MNNNREEALMQAIGAVVEELSRKSTDDLVEDERKLLEEWVAWKGPFKDEQR